MLVTITFLLGIIGGYFVVTELQNGKEKYYNRPLWMHFLIGIGLWWVYLIQNRPIPAELIDKIFHDYRYYIETGILNSVFWGVFSVIIILIIRGIKTR